jgi:hypothetical protein
MARIRTIKPEFWTDDRIGECSVSARLLFIACWNFADDKGGLDRSAKQLKAQAFPYDVIDCEPLIQELLGQRLLIEYEAQGRKYLHINGFLKHQKIDNPAKARIPPYEESSEKSEDSPSPTGGLAAEGKGRESKGKEEKRAAPAVLPPPRPATAIRIPENFELTAERRAVAEAEKLPADRTFASFVDYWHAASGAKARKHDWDAAWRIWCRKEADFKPSGKNGHGKPPPSDAATWARISTHATTIGCPLQPREHEPPEAFETRVKLWERENGPKVQGLPKFARAVQ